MVAYFDTSALIKRYFNEQGSKEVIENYFRPDISILTSSITHAEVYSTFSRVHKEGHISKRRLEELQHIFESDWSRFAVVEFGIDVRAQIPKLIEDVYVRGADLIHLSTVAAVTKRGVDLVFVCTDKKLKNAALDIGISCDDLLLSKL